MSFSGTKGWITKPPPGSVEDPFHPLSQGSVCHLLMNEGSGSRVYDISGHGNHGTLENMSPNAQDSGWGGSKFGGGLQFDGVNDYVDCGSDDSLDCTEAITIEAWVKPVSVVGDKIIMGNADYRDYGYDFYIDDGKLTFRTNQLGANQNTISTEMLSVNVWSHIVVTRSGTTARIYINGNEVNYDAQPAHTNPAISSIDFLIGTYAAVPVSNFNGAIDSVRIYNRALSAEEIKILYHDPFCNLLRVPVRYVPAAPEIIELLTTISATTSTSAPNVLMLRELASTIAATTSVSAADVDVLRELAATVASVTLTSTIELLIVSLRELSATVATVTSTSTPDLNVLRELTSTIDATTSISVASLNVLRELLSTIEVTTSTSASEMKVLRELEAIIEATTALTTIELMITMWLTSNPIITRLKSEGWFE